VLTRLLAERVPGSFTVGRLRGSVVGGLVIDELVMRNPPSCLRECVAQRAT
jgi:hypothetical protein